jgi:dolichol-phosphate mannosyltransferase
MTSQLLTEDADAKSISRSQPILSVVLSMRNEEETIPELVRQLRETLDKLAMEYEIVFVDDASVDGSLALIRGLNREDPRIKAVTLSRRFGYNQSFMVGLKYAQGDAVVTMDADLQDPPSVIPSLVERYRQGADVVHAIRIHRKGESALKMLLTEFAYRVIRKISFIDLPENAGSFKLISRRALRHLLQLNEADPYLRGLMVWVGFKQDRITYVREPRFRGSTQFPLLRSAGPWLELMSALTSFSLLPLLIPFLVSVFSVGVLIILMVGLVVAGQIPWTWVLLYLMALQSVQFLCMGVINIYVGRIWKQVTLRPNAIVAELTGYESGDNAHDLRAS